MLPSRPQPDQNPTSLRVLDAVAGDFERVARAARAPAETDLLRPSPNVPVISGRGALAYGPETVAQLLLTRGAGGLFAKGKTAASIAGLGMGAIDAGSQYLDRIEEYKATGLPEQEARIKAAYETTAYLPASLLLEKIGTEKLFQKLPAKFDAVRGFKRAGLNFGTKAATEIPTEMAQGAAQDVINSMVSGTDIDPREFAQHLMDNAFLGGITGGTVGAIAGGNPSGREGMVNLPDPKVPTSVVAQATIDQAEASQAVTRGPAPEGLPIGDTTQQVTEGAPIIPTTPSMTTPQGKRAVEKLRERGWVAPAPVEENVPDTAGRAFRTATVFLGGAGNQATVTFPNGAHRGLYQFANKQKRTITEQGKRNRGRVPSSEEIAADKAYYAKTFGVPEDRVQEFATAYKDLVVANSKAAQSKSGGKIPLVSAPHATSVWQSMQEQELSNEPVEVRDGGIQGQAQAEASPKAPAEVTLNQEAQTLYQELSEEEAKPEPDQNRVLYLRMRLLESTMPHVARYRTGLREAFKYNDEEIDATVAVVEAQASSVGKSLNDYLSNVFVTAGRFGKGSTLYQLGDQTLGLYSAMDAAIDAMADGSRVDTKRLLAKFEGMGVSKEEFAWSIPVEVLKEQKSWAKEELRALYEQNRVVLSEDLRAEFSSPDLKSLEDKINADPLASEVLTIIQGKVSTAVIHGEVTPVIVVPSGYAFNEYGTPINLDTGETLPTPIRPLYKTSGGVITDWITAEAGAPKLSDIISLEQEAALARSLNERWTADPLSAIRRLTSHLYDTDDGRPKVRWAGFGVKPGEKENYFEILLKLHHPRIGRVESERIKALMQEGRSPINHWKGEGGDNTIVHIRATERNIEGKRTLYVEEIQSDWMQSARVAGFEGEVESEPIELLKAMQAKEIELEEHIKEQVEAINGYQEILANPTNNAYAGYLYTMQEILGNYQVELNRVQQDIALLNNGNITRSSMDQLLQTYISGRAHPPRPQAPFKESNKWGGLAVKHLLTQALARGYEQIAFNKETNLKSQHATFYNTIVKGVLNDAVGKQNVTDGTIGEVDKLERSDPLWDQVDVEDARLVASITLMRRDPGTLTRRDPPREIPYDKWPFDFADNRLSTKKPEVKDILALYDLMQRGHAQGLPMPTLEEFPELVQGYFTQQGRNPPNSLATPEIRALTEFFFGEGAVERVVGVGLPAFTVDLTGPSAEKISGGLRLLYQQPAKGEAQAAVTFTDGKAIVQALTKPNASSVIHEMAHIWRRALAAQSRVDPSVLEHMRILNQWVGARSASKWTKVHEEKFARGFERYLREGKAPSTRLVPAFARFKKWLSSIYHRLKGSPLDVKLTKEVRATFDALLGGEPVGGGKFTIPSQANASEMLESSTSRANPGLTNAEREQWNAVEANREAKGKPGKVTDEEYAEQAQALLTDYEKAKDHFVEQAKQGQLFSDNPAVHVALATVITRETTEALSSVDQERLSVAHDLMNAYRDMRAMTARALRIMVDPARAAMGLGDTLFQSWTIYDEMMRHTQEFYLKRKEAAVKAFEARQAGDIPLADKLDREVAMWKQKELERALELNAIVQKYTGVSVIGATQAQQTDPILMAKIRRVLSIESATAGDKFIEFWKSGLVSAIPSILVNLTGSMSNIAFDVALRRPTGVMVGLLDAAQATITGHRLSKDLMSLGDYGVFLRGMLRGIRPALHSAIIAWKVEQPFFENYVMNVDSLHRTESKIAIKGLKGAIWRLPYRFLTFGDELNTVWYAHAAVAAYAHQRAKQELPANATPLDYENFIAAETADYKSDSWLKAIEDAQDMTFRTPVKGITRTISNLRNKPGMKVPGHMTIPFVGTPVNLAKSAIRLTPVGTLRFAYKALQVGLAKDSKEAERLWATRYRGRDLAEQILAYAIFALLGDWTEPDEDGVPFLTGMDVSLWPGAEPMTIRVAGKRRDYSRFDPLSTVLGTMADSMVALRKGKGQDAKTQLDAVRDLINNIGKQFSDKVFLKAVGDLVQLATEPGENLGYFTSEKAASFVPNLVKTGLRASTDHETKQMRTFGDTFPNKFASWSAATLHRMLPHDVEEPPATLEDLVQQLREADGRVPTPGDYLKVLPRVDAFGQIVEASDHPNQVSDFMWKFLSPIKSFDTNTQQGRAGEIQRLIANWNNQNPAAAIVFEPPSPTFGDYDLEFLKPSTGQMTPTEYFMFMRASGELATKLIPIEKMNADKPTVADVRVIESIMEDARRMTRELVQAKRPLKQR